MICPGIMDFYLMGVAVTFSALLVFIVILKRSSIRKPMIQMMSLSERRRGIVLLSSFGTFNEMKKSFNFILPFIPKGMNVSPFMKVLIVSRPSLSLSKRAIFLFFEKTLTVFWDCDKWRFNAKGVRTFLPIESEKVS